jgi:hypothetical protein
MSASDAKTIGTILDASVQRGLWLDSALDEMRRDLEEDRFASALGHFREALGLSRGLPLLRARVDQQAELYSEELLPRNWRVAEVILQEAAATDPAFSPDPKLVANLQQARHDELVAGAIHKADRLELDGKPQEARESLAGFLTAHPGEALILERLRSFDPPAPAAKPDAPVAEVQPPSEVSPLPEAIPDETVPLGLPHSDRRSELPKPWPTKVLISVSAWNAIKDLTAVVATAAMLGTAGFLVWKHFSEPQAPVLRKPILPQTTASPPQTPLPAPPSNSPFQDVPLPPSEQDTILEAVRAYSQSAGKNIDDSVVDEVDIQGKQAKVRYRPKDKSSTAKLIFSLVRQGDGWKVQNVE